MSTPLQLLIIEDSRSDAAMMVRLLSKAGYDVRDERVENADEMQAALARQIWNVVIADYRLPEFNAPAALALLQQAGLDIPFIVVSGTIGEDTAVAMMKAGAHDYLMKDKLSRLAPAIERELRDAQVRRERKQADEDLRQRAAQLALINDIGSKIAALSALEGVLERAARLVQNSFGYHHVALFLLEGGTARLKAIAGSYQDYFPPQHSQPLDRGVIGWVGSHGEKMVVGDVNAEPRYMSNISAQTITRAELCLPIKIADRVAGILDIQSPQLNAFNENDVMAMETLTHQIAVAIENAHLYEQLLTAYEDLRQTQQVLFKEERLRAMGQMASGIAHDINNALVPILGFTEILLVTEPNLTESARKRLQRIQTAGEDITHTVSRLRQLYRQRDEEESLLPVDLNQIAEQVIELTRPQWRDIPLQQAIVITVETDLEDDLPPAQGIESELREALTNLVINAAHAMPQGGVLTVLTRLVEPDLLLEVIDTGIGMDAETREHCLDPFFTTKGEQGTGLGLAMVFGTMQRHEGSLEIDSAPGQGTTIRLRFPRREWVPPADNTKANQPTHARSLRILCVDDDPRVRELIEDMLRVDGHRPTLVDGGQAGIDAFLAALAQGQPFDVVITDLGMPHVGGYEVAAAVKQAVPDIPVILLSGWGQQLQDRAERLAGVDMVLNKPATFSDLRAALAKILAGWSGS